MEAGFFLETGSTASPFTRPVIRSALPGLAYSRLCRKAADEASRLCAFPEYVVGIVKLQMIIFEVETRIIMNPQRFFILAVWLFSFFASTGKAQTVTDTIGNTIVDISVVLDTSHFLGGYLSGPWDLYWGPDDQLWYTNRTRLCRYDPLTQTGDTLLEITHGFIMGVATHSHFTDTPEVYLTIDTSDYYGGGNHIDLYKFDYSITGDSMFNAQVLLGWNHPGEHSGGRIVYGLDGKLYVSTAEYWTGYDTLFYNSGKVLRLNTDGSVPVDNPRPDYTFTFGHRNPQGIVQVPNGNLFVSEYGMQWDELNLLQVNRYYGWIVFDGVSCISNPDTCNYYDSITVFPLDVGLNPPSGIDYYDHPAIPEFNGLIQAVTGAIKQGIIAYTMNSAFDSVTAKNYYLTQKYARVRDVCSAPDGSVYFISHDRTLPDIRRISNPLFNDVPDQPAMSRLHLYPNPAGDVVHYRLTAKENTTFILTDLRGRTVWQKEENEMSGSFNLAAQAPGCYVLTASGGKRMLREKVVMIRR